ncbi:hypothetical protein CEXT_157451 [Caerostris extrusa]|uniref:Uncharacterized protein n=1 Tax=Caerostris extrusa TaxID=172846 RepID=A0AAV4UVN1_CAEEX|nr:hypothetical protein CEXT_157451 [Caerostris extrusa]
MLGKKFNERNQIKTSMSITEWTSYICWSKSQVKGGRNRDRSANDFLTVLRKCGTLTGRRRWDRSRFSHSDARNAAATVGSHVMVLFFPLPICTLLDLLTLSAIYGA